MDVRYKECTLIITILGHTSNLINSEYCQQEFHCMYTYVSRACNIVSAHMDMFYVGRVVIIHIMLKLSLLILSVNRGCGAVLL